MDPQTPPAQADMAITDLTQAVVFLHAQHEALNAAKADHVEVMGAHAQRLASANNDIVANGTVMKSKLKALEEIVFAQGRQCPTCSTMYRTQSRTFQR